MSVQDCYYYYQYYGHIVLDFLVRATIQPAMDFFGPVNSIRHEFHLMEWVLNLARKCFVTSTILEYCHLFISRQIFLGQWLLKLIAFTTGQDCLSFFYPRNIHGIFQHYGSHSIVMTLIVWYQNDFYMLYEPSGTFNNSVLSSGSEEAKARISGCFLI